MQLFTGEAKSLLLDAQQVNIHKYLPQLLPSIIERVDISDTLFQRRRCTGQWFHNQMTGYSQCEYCDGSYYEGEYQNGAKEGYGRDMTEIGTYTGEFRNNLYHGQGKIILSNGDIYHGGFQYSGWSGEGVYTKKTLDGNRSEFSGTFFVPPHDGDPVFIADGRLETANGSIFFGSFKITLLNLFNSIGSYRMTYTDTNGISYFGPWNSHGPEGVHCVIKISDNGDTKLDRAASPIVLQSGVLEWETVNSTEC